jgi:hypothetical protein
VLVDWGVDLALPITTESRPHSLQIAFLAGRARYPGGPVQVPVG